VTEASALRPLRERLAGKDPPHLIAAVGPETWLREETLRTVATAVLGSPDSPDLLTVRVDDGAPGGAEGALRNFFDEARTSSLFGGPKVVVLREADRAASEDSKAFHAWIENPSSSVTVVLLAGELKADLLAAARKNGCVVECGGRGAQTPDPVRFAVSAAADCGKRLGADEATDLVHLVGDELGALANAIEILCLHAGDEDEISPSAIRDLFPGARVGVAEEFATTLLDGRPAEALAAAARCFDEGVPEAWGSSRLARDERSVAFVLMREFARSLQRVVDARRQLDSGIPRRQVDLGRLPFRIRDAAVAVAASRRPESVDQMVLLYEDTDRGMKSGGATGRVAIARLATAVGRLR